MLSRSDSLASLGVRTPTTNELLRSSHNLNQTSGHNLNQICRVTSMSSMATLPGGLMSRPPSRVSNNENGLETLAESNEMHTKAFAYHYKPKNTDTLNKLENIIFKIAEDGNISSFENLLKSKADTDICARLEGDTILHIAAKKNRYEFIAFLLNFNFNMCILNDKGHTSADLAVGHGSLESLQFFHKLPGNNFLDHHPDGGIFAMRQAAFNGHDSTINFVLNHGFDKEKMEITVASLMNYAFDGESLSVVQFLTTLDTNLNAQDDKGNTILHNLILHNLIFKKNLFLEGYHHLLLNANCDPDIKNNENKSFRDIILQSDNKEINKRIKFIFNKLFEEVKKEQERIQLLLGPNPKRNKVIRVNVTPRGPRSPVNPARNNDCCVIL